MEDSSSLKNLSGRKLSGSVQIEGSWWMAKVGMRMFIPGFEHYASGSRSRFESNQPTFGDEKSVLLPVFDTGAIRSENWRQQPQGLLDASLQVGHLPDALLVDLSLGGFHDSVHLVHQLLHCLRVLGEAVGQGGEGAGGRLKASQDKDDCLAIDEVDPEDDVVEDDYLAYDLVRGEGGQLSLCMPLPQLNQPGK